MIPSIESVEFDTSTLQIHEAHLNSKIWYTSSGDDVSLFFIDLPPDLPKGAGSIEDLQQSFLKSAQEAGAELVEFDLVHIDGIPAVYRIVKVPQNPDGRGRVYIASIIIPFKDFSFVVMIQCMERGTTGIREAELLTRMINAGEVDVGRLLQGNLQEINFDAEEYDSEFPQHPLSRARREIRAIQQSIKLDPYLKGLPQYELISSRENR